MKRSLMALAALAAFSTGVLADGISANVGLTSKYKYRGQDQSDVNEGFLPAIQGGFDYTYGNFYLGNWNSSIGFGGGTEMDFYGGFKSEFGVAGVGLGYDVGLLTYYYPGSNTSSLNTTEIYGGLSWNILTAKLSWVVSDKYFGLADNQNTLYWSLGANYEVIKGLTLNGSVGYTDLKTETAGVAESYTDYRIGATYDLGSGFNLGGHFVGANKDNAWGGANKDRLIVTLTKSM